MHPASGSRPKPFAGALPPFPPGDFPDSSRKAVFYYCKYCSFKCPSVVSLKAHTTSSHGRERPFACSFCPLRFALKTDLRRHLITHTGQKPHKCPNCPKTFIREDHLRKHVNKEASKPLRQCSFCSYSSNNIKNVERHVRFKHTLERPFPCHLCHQRFAEKIALERHMRSHTGERPYACPRCAVRFRHNKSLKIHLQTSACCNQAS
ncbi:UNVERIFIED_CONTAM: hypothetical protein GTU68_040166 [Idotea baltica]|nr:hypothetical protein [Idotea baltica]